jgi:hypothetical protein
VIQWGDTGLKSLSQAFYQCKELEEIADDTTGALAEVDAYSYAFYKCTALKAIPAGLFNYAIHATSFNYAFAECSSLTGESPYTMVNGQKIHLYERNGQIGGLDAPANTAKCFGGCYGLDDYEGIPDSWK